MVIMDVDGISSDPEQKVSLMIHKGTLKASNDPE